MATSQIATNIGSVHAHNVFARNNTSMSAALNRVSTGLKISSAKDNASQYAISEKMLERINANQQASQNVQTDQALTNTASGAISNIVDIIKQLRSRAIDAANDSNNADDRATIQNDIKNLIAQIDYTASNTKFNGNPLLDGSTNAERVICETTATAFAAVTTSDKLSDVLGVSKTDTVRMIVSWADSTGAVTVDKTSVTDLKGSDTLKEALVTKGTSLFTAGNIKEIAANAKYSKGTDENYQDVKAAAAGIEAFSSTGGKSGNFSGLTITLIGNSNNASKTYEFGSLVIEGKDQKTEANALTFQIGDSTGMTTDLAIGDMSASGLGINGIDVSGSREVAEATINVIDAAFSKALEKQAAVGAMEQRLGFTADNLDTMNENLQASASAIRDADMAKEISDYMKWSVISQASQYMLAQSNQNAFQVLNLLQ